ncbi:hypothetical protein CCL09_18475 [Pseudomonas congelans]|nr:hypothetical protein CCL09_18475 [Pseudomonas congelans]
MVWRAAVAGSAACFGHGLWRWLSSCSPATSPDVWICSGVPRCNEFWRNLMFIRRKLSLDPNLPSLAQPLLRRECFSDVALASEHLQRARAEARALLADAQVEVERMLAEAQADFWARADAFLGDWEAERQAQRDALVEQAQGLLSQTLKTLLDEFPQEQRALALVRQLDQSQSRPVRATLRCAVDMHEPVEAWLQRQPRAHWQLERDTGLASGTLLLSTEQGDFGLDWERLRTCVLELA